MYQQMSMAWHKGIQKFWILNVGDIKPAEYQIELFLDMAWNMNSIYPGDSADKDLLPNNDWLAQQEMNFWTRGREDAACDGGELSSGIHPQAGVYGEYENGRKRSEV